MKEKNKKNIVSILVLASSLYALQPSLIWQKTYSISGYDMVCDWEGNIYITGGGGGKIVTIKISPNGDTIWRNEFKPFPSASIGQGMGITLDEQNIYVIALASPQLVEYGIYLLKYNSLTGDTLYGRYYHPFPPSRRGT